MMRKNRFLLKMVGKSRKLKIAKYLFIGLLVLCLTVVASLLYFSDNSSNQSENVGDVKYVKIAAPEFSEDMLSSEFDACFFTISSNFSSSTSSSTSNHKKETESHNEKIEILPLMNTLLLFAELSHQLKIELILIEPSLLFCILSPTLKSILLKRNFTVANRSENVLTLGIYQKDVFILEKEDVRNRLANIGFQIEIVKSRLGWMKPQTFLNSSVFPSHVFLQRDEWILHLVVFHERKSFLWHSALPLSQLHSRTVTKGTHLLFVDADSAFENFTAVSLGFKVPRLKYVNIPTNPASFLHQISASRFLECNETVVSLFQREPVSNLSTHHEYSSLSVPEFNQRLLITIEELKMKLNPMLIRFWIWSGTLLGLHRQCDVIPYTSDADFATWATDADDVDKLINYYKQNEHLTMRQKLGRVEEGLELKFKCHGLAVDLFFVYEQENGTWYAGHSPRNGYYFKYHHPTFSLCSAELLGQKVNVPCEPEHVITAEYGLNWMHPVSSWNYEHSVHNRGPNIFWEKSLLKKVYLNF